MSTVIVGRIAVKVTPDTSRFKETLRAQLSKIEKSVNDIKVKVEPDTDGLKAKVQAAAKKVEESTKAITLKVNADVQSSVQRAISQLERELERLGEKDLKVKLNADDITRAIEDLRGLRKLEMGIDPSSERSVKRSLDRVQAELDKFKEVQISVGMDEGDLTKLRDKLAADVKAFEKKAQIELQVDSVNQDSLRRAIAKLDQELDKLKPKIGVDLDEKSLSDMKRKLAAQLQKLEADTALKLHYEKNVSRDIIRRESEHIQRELDKIKLRPGLDPKKAIDGLGRIEEKMWQLRDLKLTLTPDLDQRAYREVKRKMDRLKDDVDKIKSEIEPEVKEGHYRFALAKMAILARTRIAQIVPVVSKSAAANAGTALAALSGARLTGDVLTRLWDGVKNIDKAAPKILKVSSALFSVAASIGASVSNVAALSASLISILPLALSLPGILGGIAIGAGITFVALRDFGKVLPDVVKQFKEMGKVISSGFWKEAEAPIRRMSNELLPKFKKELQGTSKEIGKWFGSFSTELAKSLSPVLDDMFANLNGSVGIFEKATKPLAGIISSLGQMGSKLLPDLASWLLRHMTTFDAFLDRIRKDKTWDGWVEVAKLAIKDLGRVFKSVGKILADVGQVAAASGGAGLGMLADTLERIESITNGSKFKTGLGNFFKGAHGFFEAFTSGAGKGIGDLFYALGDSFAKIAPNLGGSLGKFIGALTGALAQPAFQRSLVTFFDSIGKALISLAPFLPGIADNLGKLAVAFGKFLEAAGPSLGSIISSIADALGEMAPVLPDLANVLFPALADAVKELAPSLKDIAINVLPVMVDALKVVLPLVTSAVKAFADFAKEHPNLALLAIALGAVAFALKGFIAKTVITLAWKFAIAPVLTAIGGLATPILARFGTMIAGVATKIPWGKMIGKIGPKLLGPIGLAIGIADIGHALMPTFDRMAQYIYDTLPGPLQTAFAGAFAVVLANPVMKGFRTGLDQAFDDMWPDRFPWQDTPPGPPLEEAMLQIADVASRTLAGIKPFFTAIGDSFQPIIDKFTTAKGSLNVATGGAIDTIAGVINGRAAGLAQDGKNLAGGIVGAVTGMFTGGKPSFNSAVSDLVSGATSRIKAGLAPAAPTASMEILRLQGEIQNKRPGINAAASSAVSGVNGSIKAGLSGLKQAGATGMGNFVSGITGMVGTVTAAATRISAAGKPPAIDASANGASIGNSFAAGMYSTLGRVLAAALAIASAASAPLPRSPAKVGPFSGKGWVLFGGISVGEAFADGMESKSDRVTKAARNMLSGASAVFDGFAPDMAVTGLSATGVSLPSYVEPATSQYGSAAGQGAGNTVNVNIPVKTDANPEAIADELLFALRRVGGGGVYASR